MVVAAVKRICRDACSATFQGTLFAAIAITVLILRQQNYRNVSLKILTSAEKRDLSGPSNPWLEQGFVDLREYDTITKEQVEAALQVPHAIHLVVRQNRIYVKHRNDTWLQQQIMDSIKVGVPHSVFHMFFPLACIGELPDIELALTVEDIHRPPIGNPKIPLFCWSKKVGQSGILYPYWQHFHTNSTQEFYSDRAPLWSEKSSIAFFRGSTTGTKV